MDSLDDNVLRDAAKKRLKVIAEKNTKVKETNPVFMSLYSDEELNVTEALQPEEEELPNLALTKTNEEINGKRLYRTDRTKNTDSELSEGEIVDDDDEEVTLPISIPKGKSECDKKLLDSRKPSENTQRFPPNRMNNRMNFDLRQRIQSNRNRFSPRGNRGYNHNRFRGRPRRSRSRSYDRRASRDTKSNERRTPPRKRNNSEKDSKTKSDAIENALDNLDEEALRESKEEIEKQLKKTEKKHEKPIKEMPLLATVRELTTFLPDDDEDIKKIKRELMEMQAKLKSAMVDTEPAKTLDLPTINREGTPPLLSLPEKTLDKKSSAEKRPHDKKSSPKKEKSESDKKKPSSTEKPRTKHSRSRSRTPKPLAKVKSEPKSESKKSLNISESKSESKKVQNISKKLEETPKSGDNKKKDRLYSVNMIDGSIKEIAFVNHTTTLPKIIYSSRSNLTPTAESGGLTAKPIISPMKVELTKKLPTTEEKKPHREVENALNNKTPSKQLPIENVKEMNHSIERPTNKESGGDKAKSHRRHTPERSQNHKSHSATKPGVEGVRKVETEVKRDNKSDKNPKSSSDKHSSDRHFHDRDRRSKVDTEKRSGDTKDSEKRSAEARKRSSPERRTESSNKTVSDKRKTTSEHRSDSRRDDSKKDGHNRKTVDKHQASVSKEKSSKPKDVDKDKDKDKKEPKLENKSRDTPKVKSEPFKESTTRDKESFPKCDTKTSSHSDSARVTTKKRVREEDDKNKSSKKPLSSSKVDVSKSKPKPRHEPKPTLSFVDELLEVQGLKPAEDEIESPKEIVTEVPLPSESPNNKKPLEIVTEAPLPSESPSNKNRQKQLEHAVMLKRIESNVEEILAPLSEIEKLALDRKTLKPEDLFNKMMDLCAQEMKSVDTGSEVDMSEAAQVTPKPDVIDINPESAPNDVSIAVKLESEYETFINSLTPVKEPPVSGNPETQEDLVKMKTKVARSLSQSTNSSHTSGTTNSTSGSSSSSDSDSSNSDSSGSESESDSIDTQTSVKKKEVKEQLEMVAKKEEEEVCSPSQTPPRQLLPVKSESTVSSTIDSQTPELLPLPDNRETPIKIQMNSVQKVLTINKHLNEGEEPLFGNENAEEKRASSKEKSKSRKRSRSRSASQKKTVHSKSSSVSSKKPSKDTKKRHFSRSRSRDNDRRHVRQASRGNSRDRHKRRRSSLSPIRRQRRSRDRSYRRSISRSPVRRPNSRRLSPLHHRPRSPRSPRSPRTPDSWKCNDRHNFLRSRSCSRSPERQRKNAWNRYDDYRRPPSPQSDTESPVAGFKRSLADSTISDAELEQQQLFKIQTHMTTEGFYSYMEPDAHTGLLHDSPRRLSLDDRINMALGTEPTKYSYGINEDYRYNNFQNNGPVPFHPHHSHQLQYRYDPVMYNAPPQPGPNQNIPHYRYNHHQPPMHNAPPPSFRGPPGYDRDFQVTPYQPRNIKPLQQVPLVPNTGGVVQKGNMLEIVPTTIDHAPLQGQPEPKKKKLFFTAEELQSRKDKKLEMRKKRKAERDKKRLEKKMRKEKLKLEIKRLVSIGVKDEVLSSDEDQPFDDITRKGIYGTGESGILKKDGSETKPVKKTVKFADGILPGYGSSHSDSEQKTELSPSSGVVNINEKRKKKQKRRKKSAATENNENQTDLPPLPIEFNIPPELEHAQPPAPPDGDPSADLQQPRFLYPNRVPMLFFHLLRVNLRNNKNGNFEPWR